MTRCCISSLSLLLLLVPAACWAQDKPDAPKIENKPTAVPEREKLFKKFEESMTNVKLVGRYTIVGKDDDSLKKEEYTISTSEFQRVKSHLMRQTNAKAGVQVDFDQTDDSRPTLKKRTADSTDGDGESSSTEGPPQLKKKGEPEAKPTPSPQP